MLKHLGKPVWKMIYVHIHPEFVGGQKPWFRQIPASMASMAHRFQGHGNLTGRALHETGLRIFWVDHQASLAEIGYGSPNGTHIGYPDGAGAGS